MAFAFFPSKIAATKQDDEFRQDLNVRLICVDCTALNPENPPPLIEDYKEGDLICSGCGKVLGDRIVDTRSEWRTFANDEGDDPSRVGGPTNPLLDGPDNLETVISFRDGNTGVSRELQRAANKVSQKTGEKSLQNAFHLISNMCDHISLPKTIADFAKQLFKRADDEKLLRGKPLDAIIAACIFIACRQAKVPRTFKEIVALTKVPKKQIGQCFKTLESHFETSSVVRGLDPGEDPSGGSPENLVPRFCNHLNLPPPIQSASAHVVKAALELGILAGRSPISVVAASIFFATNLFGIAKSMKEIAIVTGVSDVTIRTSYKLLYARKEDVIQPKWLEAGKKVSSLPEM